MERENFRGDGQELKEFTDSISCPMLTMWEIGDGVGILGMKREGLATDASLVASSSTNEFVAMSCNTRKQ